MDGRTIARGLLGLALLTTGCRLPGMGTAEPHAGLIPTPQMTAQANAAPAPKPPEPSPAPVKTRAPGTGSAKIEITMAEMREQQAQSAADNPDARQQYLDEARKAYQAALKVEPQNLDATRGLARVYVQLQDFDRANDTYQKALAKNPKCVPLWMDWGQAYNRRKDTARAIACFHKALECDPENRQVHSLLGFTLGRTGQFDQALVHLTRASGAAQAHFYLGRIALDQQQEERAKRYFELALRQNPSHQEAREMLASLDAPPSSGIATIRFQP